MDQEPRAPAGTGTPLVTSVTMRGLVEAVSGDEIRVGRRWWRFSPTAAFELPVVGQIVELEARDGVVVRLTCLASPDPEGCESET